MANSSIDRESSFLSKLMTKRLGMPSLIRAEVLRATKAL
jgi:hypothetical protein